MHPYQHAVAHPGKAVYVMAESGEVVTYAQLDKRSNQGAHWFRSKGLTAGDVVAIFMQNDARYMEVVWAAQRSGLYFTCVPTRLTAEELAYMLTDSGAKAVIHSPNLAGVANAAAKLSGGLIVQECGGRGDARQSFELERARFPETAIADESAGRDLIYSSGTTGRPKGIMKARPSTGIETEMEATVLGKALYAFDEHIVYLCPAPLYHAGPLRYVFATAQVGGTAVIMEKFDPEKCLALIEQYRVTHAQFVPTHFVRMLRLPPEVRARYDLTSLRVVFHAAAPCPIEVKREMLNWWGPVIHEYYGSTEVIGYTSVTPQEWIERPGTVGKAKLGVIHICDEQGNELPPRREGILYFSGGPPLQYLNDPAKTREAHNSKGWATVGDIGWVDEEGYLYLTDRKNFTIISGGVKIYPQEVENALIAHPKVADAAVLGVPDAEMGEKVLAVVQPVDWSEVGDALTAELLEYLRGRISSIKLPRQIDYMQRLPREPTGKLFKRLLRDKYWGQGVANENYRNA
jgi:long-chain acyl-CoA synthetase